MLIALVPEIRNVLYADSTLNHRHIVPEVILGVSHQTCILPLLIFFRLRNTTNRAGQMARRLMAHFGLPGRPEFDSQYPSMSGSS